MNVKQYDVRNNAKIEVTLAMVFLLVDETRAPGLQDVVRRYKEVKNIQISLAV